jgi:hypothetical protein
MSAATHVGLEYLPTPTSRAWRRSSVTMWAAGRANLEKTAAALQVQEGWHAWRVIEVTP